MPLPRFMAGASAVLGAIGVGTLVQASSVLKVPPKVIAGDPKPGLPEYSEADVAAHRNPKEGPVWVFYRGGVYDVSSFIDAHPGGRNRLMLAAGSSIEPFWRQFQIHNADAVREILEKHRIGNLKGFDAAKEAAKAREAEIAAEKLWAAEPKRHPALDVKAARPFNAESPPGALTEHIVPNDLFFVRNHMAVPTVEMKDFCLEVRGEGLKTKCHTLEDLANKFSERTITATIMCAGNRRTEAAKGSIEVRGLPWTSGAIGNATWTGVWLRDVIADALGNDPLDHDWHVRFTGADKDGAGQFEVSIPVDMAMDPNRDVLIATQMNGEPIPRDHGHPLRLVVPGVVGVRNCKWLTRVEVCKQESQSDWQQRDYKNYPPWLKSPEGGYDSAYNLPVQSQIIDAKREGRDVTVKGYAYCGGGKDIQRVEISPDGGKTFTHAADIVPLPKKASRNKQWTWRHFESTFELKGAAGDAADETDKPQFSVCTRAVSSSEDTQPPASMSNFRGHFYNGYSCVTV